jgi:hypothetical protein
MFSSTCKHSARQSCHTLSHKIRTGSPGVASNFTAWERLGRSSTQYRDNERERRCYANNRHYPAQAGKLASNS